MHRRAFLATCLCAACTSAARAGGRLVEAHMRFRPTGDALQVAVTFDACMGQTDQRILDTLISHSIPATIFATRLWLDSNPRTVETLLRHRDLIVVQNHGAHHLAAVIGNAHPYGIDPVGTPDGLFAEVMGGAQAVQAAFGVAPSWYRDATALYSPDAMPLIGTMGFRIAGFSLNGDFGASVAAETAHVRIAGASAGDIVIAHINQPQRPAGAGVADGLKALKERGVRFVHLDEVEMVAAT